MLLVKQCLSPSPWTDNRTPSKTSSIGITMTQHSKSSSQILVHSVVNKWLLLKVTISIHSISSMTLTMPMTPSVCLELLERPQLRSSHQQRPDARVHQTPSHHHWMMFHWLSQSTTRMSLMVWNSYSSTHQELLRPLLLEDQPMVVLKSTSMVTSSTTLEIQSVSLEVSQLMLSFWPHLTCLAYPHHSIRLERPPWLLSIERTDSTLVSWSISITNHQLLNKLNHLADHSRDSPRSILLELTSVRTMASDMLHANSTTLTPPTPPSSATTPCTVTHQCLTYLIVIQVITTTASR